VFRCPCAPRRQDSAGDVRTRWGEQLCAPAALSPGKGRSSHCAGGWVGSRAGLDAQRTGNRASVVARPPCPASFQVLAPPGSTLLNCALCLDTVSCSSASATVSLHHINRLHSTRSCRWHCTLHARKSLLHSLLMTDAHSNVTCSLLVLKTGEKIECRVDELEC
jgi:hypothetical protein